MCLNIFFKLFLIFLKSLYNIVKICRVSALTKFGELFDILWKLTSDTDQNVRSGSELLDRLIKVFFKLFKIIKINFILFLKHYTVTKSKKVYFYLLICCIAIKLLLEIVI